MVLAVCNDIYSSRFLPLIEKILTLDVMNRDLNLKLEICEAYAITLNEVGQHTKAQNYIEECFNFDLVQHNINSLYSVIYSARICGIREDDIKSIIRKKNQGSGAGFMETAAKCFSAIHDFENSTEKKTRRVITMHKHGVKHDKNTLSYAQDLIQRGQISRLDVVMYSLTRTKSVHCGCYEVLASLKIVNELIVRSFVVKSREYLQRLIIKMDHELSQFKCQGELSRCGSFSRAMVDLLVCSFKMGMFDEAFHLIGRWAKLKDLYLIDEAAEISNFLAKLALFKMPQLLEALTSFPAACHCVFDSLIHTAYELGNVHNLFLYLDKIDVVERRLWSLATEILNFDIESYSRISPFIGEIDLYISRLSSHHRDQEFILRPFLSPTFSRHAQQVY